MFQMQFFYLFWGKNLVFFAFHANKLHSSAQQWLKFKTA